MSTDIKRKLFAAQDAERAAKEAYDKAMSEVDAAKNEIREHPGVALTTSDHALVRYMESFLGMNLQQYRTQMLNLCDKSTSVDEQNRADGLQTLYKTEGPNENEGVFVVKTNNIVTCYVNDQAGRQV